MFQTESIVGTSFKPEVMFNKEHISYKKIKRDYGTSYVVVVRPAFLEFLDNFSPPDSTCRFPYPKQPGDCMIRTFYLGDESRNTIKPQYPRRIWQYIDTSSKDWYLNNLSIPKHLDVWAKLAIKDAMKRYFGLRDRLYLQPHTLLNYSNISLDAVDEGLSSIIGSHPEDVLHNSQDYPLQLSLDNVRKVNYREFLDFASVTEYDDTGTVYFHFNIVGYAYNQKTNNFYRHRNDKYSLKVRKHGAKTSILKNGRFITGSNEIARAFFYSIVNSWIGFSACRREDSEYANNIFLKLFEKHFLRQSISNFLDSGLFCAQTVAERLARLYRVRRNRQLNDLPWGDIDLSNIYNITDISLSNSSPRREYILARNNMNRYLRKGDTKRAIDALFYGIKFPKAIRKLLFKIPPLSLSYKSAKLLYRVYEKYDTNITLSIMQNQAGEVALSHLKTPEYLIAILQGFKKSRLMSVELQTIKDVMRMKNTLKREGINTDYRTNNFIEYHDYLSNLYTAIMQSGTGAHNMAYKSVDTSKQLPSMQINGFTLRSPKLANELIDVGSDMRHCVASYCRRYFYRQLEILLLEKDGVYVACIEIHDKDIVQAKLKFNEPIINNSEAFSALEAWASEHNFYLACRDCGVDYDYPFETEVEPDVQRLASVSRMKYILACCTAKFTTACKHTLKEVLSPKWLRVLDSNCSINQQIVGNLLWYDFEDEYERDSIPF